MGRMRHLIQSINIPGVEPLQQYQRDQANALPQNDGDLLFRLVDSLSRTWDLGLTAFGGPPVLFQIVQRRFVEGKDKVAWVDEQTVRPELLIYTSLKLS